MKPSLKKLLSVILLAVMVFSIAGTAIAAPVKGRNKNIFRVGMSAEPTSMDPAKSKDLITWMFIMQTYDTLIKYDYPTKKFVPALAKKWVVNKNSTEVEFTIRDDVYFHNGDKMTMDDVIFSLNRALKSSFTAQINGSIKEITKIDDSRLKIVLKYSYAPILEVLITPCWGIVNRKHVEATEKAGKDVGRIASCGTGAYRLKEWRSGEKLIFEAFDKYYEGKPAIKNVEATLITDQSSGAIALENGTLDYYYGTQNNDIEHLRKVPTLKVYTASDGVGIYDITFNVTNGIFKDKRLRQAVAYALDREEILLGGQEGYGTVTDTICATAAFGYTKDYKWYKQDIEKAKKLMAEAGYPNGFKVTFTQDSSRTYMMSAEIMQAQLKKIGIDVVFDKLERATWLDTVATNRQFTASLRMTNHVVNDADYILTRRLTTGMIGGGNNYAGYSNKTFDALVEKARTTSDPKVRLDLYRQCFDIIKEDVPFIPLYTTITLQVVAADIKGWNAHPTYKNPWSQLSYE